ncbi:MAG: RsbRD N-terminal domain-containing protein [Gracilibacteraceae bacterium]|jgi:hypothetical protein|nr:RsbRD N-terminal domain-containing protein [Gracilibacteraceae bacterium]
MQLTIYDELQAKKTNIINRWRRAIAGPSETNPFTGGAGGGRFANPAAYAVEQAATAVFHWLLTGEDPGENPGETPAEPRQSLSEIIQLKAVQALRPGEALAFIFELKDIISAELTGGDGAMIWAAELRKLERRIDGIMLTAFELYADQRQRIADIRVAEMKRLYRRDAV